MFEPIKQDPPTALPDLFVSLICTVKGVSHLCNSEGMIIMAEDTLEWHIPFWSFPLYLGVIPATSPFDNFTPQSLTFIANCANGSLSSTLTFVANREFKNTPFQCALRMDSNHPLSLKKVWSQAIALNGILT